MSESAIALTVVALFAVVFPAFWIGVTMLIAQVGGWFRLQTEFPDRPQASRIKTLGYRSAQLGHPLYGASYSGVLFFDVCEEGLRIRVWKLFGLFCKPIFLEWDDFRTEQYRWLMREACRMRWGPDTRD
ncbi:MAG: hypothetical protein AAGK01_08530, partial [Pseudomonadota bacterium]